MEREKKILMPSFSLDLVLECARGLSALWVFIFHISDAFEKTSHILYTIARFGYQGVPVFFVISGYCIYSAAEKTIKNNQRPNTFLARRLVRVMPPFWASIVIVVILPFFIEAISSIKSGSYVSPSPKWMEFTGMDWLQIITLTRDVFRGDADPDGAFSPLNTVYWSLAIELQLYFAMYLALYFKSKWKKFLLAVLVISVPICISPALNVSGLFIKFWPAFFLGILLRWTHQRGFTPYRLLGKNELWACCLGSGILILAVATFIFSQSPISSDLSALVKRTEFIAVSAVAALFLWTLGGVEHGIRSLNQAQARKLSFFLPVVIPVSWLGESSYSLYLLHGKLYQLPSMFLRQIFAPDNILFPLLTVFTTAILCFGFYKLVEVPFQRKGKHLVVGKPLIQSTKGSEFIGNV